MNCPNLHERLTRGRNNGRSCYPISGCSGVDSIWLTLTQSKLKTLCRNYTFLDTISPTQYNPPAYSDQNTRDLIVLTWTERTSNDYWREGNLSAFQTGRLLKHSKFVNYLHNFYQVNLNWQHQQKLQLDAKHGDGDTQNAESCTRLHGLEQTLDVYIRSPSTFFRLLFLFLCFFPLPILRVRRD